MEVVPKILEAVVDVEPKAPEDGGVKLAKGLDWGAVPKSEVDGAGAEAEDCEKDGSMIDMSDQVQLQARE